MSIFQKHIKFVGLIVVFYTIWSLRATLLYFVDELFTSDLSRTLYSTLVKVIIWGGLAFAFAFWCRHQQPLVYLRMSRFPSLQKWAACLCITIGYFSLIILYEFLIGGKVLTKNGLVSVVTVSGWLFFVISPFIEEVLFRGVFLKELLKIVSKAWANILASLLFVGIHLPFWLTHQELNTLLLANCIAIFIFSLIAGWLYIKSDSIWPSVVVHIANNILASSLVFSSVP